MRIPIPRPALPLLAVASAAACGGDAESAEVAALPAAVEIASPAAVGSGEPNLAVGPDGRVYLSWIEPAADSAHALRFAVLTDSGWSAPRTVAQGSDWFVNWADFPSMAVMPDGRLAAHWLQKSAGGTYTYDVRVALSDDGGETWTPGVVPHGDGVKAEHGFVSMWPAAGGDSLALVWLDGRKYGAGPDGAPPTDEMTLRYTTIGRDGTPAPDREIDPRICDCCQTSAAMTSAGPLVVYRDRSPSEPKEIRDVYVTRMVGGAWTEGRPVHADGWEMTACPVNGPAADADGRRVAVAWFTGARDTAKVQVAFSADAGETFGAPLRVDAGNPAGRVDVLMLEGGAALVSWVERVERVDGDQAEVRVRRVHADGRMGAPAVVATSSAARSSGFPRMARGAGGVVFAWTAPGDSARVHTARMAMTEER